MSHSQDIKLKAALAYVLHGSIGAAAAAVGLPKTTIANWTRTSEWSEIVRNLKAEHEAEITADLSRILHTVLGDLLSRVELGNPIVDKTGKEVGREPLSASELCMTLSTVTKMQDRLREVDEVAQGSRRLEQVAELLRARGVMLGEDAALDALIGR